MTLFEFKESYEIEEPGWNYNTLKPPLKLKDIMLDIKNQWHSYHRNNLIYNKRIKFVLLRIFQRIAYNLGWVLTTKKFRKLRISNIRKEIM